MFVLRLAAMFSTMVSALPWIKSAGISHGLPKSIEIFTLNVVNSIYGNLTGSMVKFDMKDTNLDFRVVHTNEGEMPMTPMEYTNLRIKSN